MIPTWLDARVSNTGLGPVMSEAVGLLLALLRLPLVPFYRAAPLLFVPRAFGIWGIRVS